jgi:tellurite methyltransferase
MAKIMEGGYDAGYAACPCFWGHEPGRLVKLLATHLKNFKGLTILDAGCGEGKNAIFLALQGAYVRALDISELAINNARRAWLPNKLVTWEISDIRTVDLPDSIYDIVIAYGLLHCLSSMEEITGTVEKLKGATKSGGYNILCAFNNRYQELTAHPEFVPFLCDHHSFLNLYVGWEIKESSDSNLTEVHPHNKIEHTHSLTRLIARKLL